ncbi:MAG: glycosyltransferase family 2 protein, partial [Candidatus Thorarchaeota archaeon]
MNYLAHSDPIFSILTEMLKKVAYAQKLIGKRLALMEVQYSKQKNNLLGWQITGILLYVFTFTILIVGSIYFVWSIVLISQQTNSTTILQTILNILSLCVEVIGIFYTVMLFKHVSTTCFNPPTTNTSSDYTLQEFPLVSILLPIREANPKILESSLNAILQSNYPIEKIQIIVGDDTDPSYPDYRQVKEICEKSKVDYIHDITNLRFKAGMLNIMLKEVKADYLVLLDYDHQVSPDFIRKSVSVLLNNDDIAFVQSKVNFYNIKSRLQVWEAVMYAQFFELFERSKNQRSTVLFNGSTACFRKTIIEEVGGIPADTFTEDIDLSIQILTKGYKSTLIDEYGSFGLIPGNFSLLLSQILRWAKGSMHTLKLRWKKILVGKMKIYDKIDLYFSTLLFFVASSMYLTILLYVIMFFTNSIAIRLPIDVFPPLIIMPIA